MLYTGGCHCGRVKFEVEGDFSSAMACNCSICTKRGSLLGFVPSAHFKLLSGEDDLAEYRFNRKVIQHLFCHTCGILSFGQTTTAQGADMKFINLRCVDGLDLGKLKIQEYDGRSR